MEEKIQLEEVTDELYQEYLDNILDLVIEKKEIVKTNNNSSNFNNDLIPAERILNKKAKVFKMFDVTCFSNGLAYVRRINTDGKYNIINTKGIVLSDTWYDTIETFHDGCARVMDNAKYSFINRDGKRINNDWYDEAKEFKNGYAIVKKSEKYGVINTDGKLLFETKYEIRSDVIEGFVIIQNKNSKRNYINLDGNIISKKWFDYVYEFKNGFGIVNDRFKWNYIGTDGKPLAEKWFNGKPETFDVFGKEITYSKGKTTTIIGEDGRIIFVGETVLINDKGISVEGQTYPYETISYNVGYDYKKDDHFITINRNGFSHVICRNIDLNGYSVTKTITGRYKLQKGKDSFIIKNKPIKVFGSNIVLYIEYDNLAKGHFLRLYNRQTNETVTIGQPCCTTYDDNIIIYQIREDYNATVYFIYNDTVYDISHYYNSGKLQNKDISIKPGYNILSKSDFFYENEKEIRRLVEEKKCEDKKARSEIEQKYKITEIKELKKHKEFDKENTSLIRKEALKRLAEDLKLLDSLGEPTEEDERIIVDNLFIDKNEYRIINPQYLEKGVLKYIDLSGETFKSAKINGIDFRGTNVNLDPQKLYKNEDGIIDLSNCNFEGIFFRVSTDFTGVNICGSRFSSNGDFKVFDINETSLLKGIYDEKTTLDGIPLTIIYGNSSSCKKCK